MACTQCYYYYYYYPIFFKNIQEHTHTQHKQTGASSVVRTAHQSELMTVHSCSTQYNTEQFR